MQELLGSLSQHSELCSEISHPSLQWDKLPDRLSSQLRGLPSTMVTPLMRALSGSGL